MKIMKLLFVLSVLSCAMLPCYGATCYVAKTEDESNTYLHILSSGQSLSVYSEGPVLSTSQPYDNEMLSPGPTGTSGPLIPLVETTYETPSSGMANSLYAYDQLKRPVVVGLHGVGGAAYSELKKGTTPYANGMLQAATTKRLVEAAGYVYKPIGVTIVHGESDYVAGNSGRYEGFLEEWQNDYQTDINALTGSNSILPLFTNQVSEWTGEMAIAQFSAHKDNPGKIILTGPKYQYKYASDTVHLTSISEKSMGEMFAKVINKVVLNGQTWNPLMPTQLIKSGNIITISYAIPYGTLAIDTTNVAEVDNYGFEFTQDGGSSIGINSVQLVNGNTQVQLTLSGVPDGTNQRVRYAWTYLGGNIRDTDSSVSPASGSTGIPLYDWGVTFDEPVKTGSATSTSSSTTTTSSTTSTTSIGTTTSTTLSSDSLVLRLAFDESSGTTAHDSSGVGNDGALAGGPSWVSGRLGGALGFDGSNDYVQVANSPSLSISDAITIAAWIKPAASQEYCHDGVWGNYGVLASANSCVNSTTWSWQLRYGAAPTTCYLGFQFNTAGGSTWVTVGQSLSSGQWYHVAATYDGSQARSYLNGQLKETQAMSAILADASNKVYVGVDGWGNYFSGSVDDVRIYHRSLSSSEINQLCTATTTTTTTRTTPSSTRPRVPGDANGDGHVDYSDLIILAASYDKQAGESGYDFRADFTGDGLVGYGDLMILAANYGS